MKRMYIFLSFLGLILLLFGIYGIMKPEKISSDNIPPSSNDTPLSNEEKGKEFEDFIVSRFSPGDYVLVEKVNDYSSRNHNTERSKYADLVFRKKKSNKEFAVECKYRSYWNGTENDKSISWVDQRKIDDYNQFSNDRGIDFIVVFGVGGSPSNPEEVYALPLRLLQKPLPQRYKFLQNFRLSDPHSFYNYDELRHSITL